jgi:hypothetical protein
MHKTGKIPDDFKKSVMVPKKSVMVPKKSIMVPKKSKSTNCEEYRIVSILTHTSNILRKIILGRIEKTTDENRAEDEFGFRKNRGKQEAILYL